MASNSRPPRLVTQRPERVSLMMIAALCDIFSCGPEDLVTVTATDAKARKVASDANVVDLNKTIRPKRARVIRDDG
ncbi:helix-turn-helix domain-containing protein [Arthrobacter sp. TS-15]|uniref:helix-turn-helix domain-containing protein n=1 Tax=Arthrobacter sp. TS-15 TaxID=2510797 RepID=UPI001EE8E921|nr:helix-turn-helix domain-containing protein [Arthrobacter sp. TS-15]